MMPRLRRWTTPALALSVLFAMAEPARAQFGKNKVTYRTFDWHVYHSPHFDAHFYPEMEPMLAELVSELESAYLEVSRKLDHELKERVPVLLYRTHAEFEQTNVQLSEIPEAVGAFAEPFQGRMVLPVDDPPDKRYALMKHELTHIFEFDILYAGSVRRAVRSNPPLWLMEGLASYIADDEDSFDQMIIRDAVLNNQVPSVRQMAGFSFLNYRYGHALFDFVEETWGAQGVRTLLFEYRKVLLANAIDKAFQDAFGLDVEQFDRRFGRFLRRRYLPVLTEKRSPEEYGEEIGLSKPGRFTFSPTLSPSGELVAALATPTRFDLDVVILSAKDGKLIRNLTKGLTTRYDGIVTEAFTGKRDLTWSPDGDVIAFFVSKERRRRLALYDAIKGRRLAMIDMPDDLANQASPAFSPDGRWIAFSAHHDGYSDIFRYDLETGEITNLTEDTYFDSNPMWSADGETIIYNRRIGPFEKIYTVRVGEPQRKVGLTAGAASDIQPAFSRDGSTVYFASDRGDWGVFNIHRLDLATGTIERLTDLAVGAFSPVAMPDDDEGNPRIVLSAFFGGTFRLYRATLAGEEVARAIEVGASEPQTSIRAPSRRRQRQRDEARRGEVSRSALPAARRGWPGLRLGAVTFDPGAGGVRPLGTWSFRTGRERAFDQLAARVPPPPRPWPAPAPVGPPAPNRTRPPARWIAPLAPAAAGDAGADASADLGDPDDLRPFEPPLKLTLDASRKEPYRTKWGLDVPDISVGVTDSGLLISDVTVNFSDLLGDQRISVRSFNVSSFNNTSVAYANFKRRFDWGAQVFDFRDFYTLSDFGISGDDRRVRRATRLTGASVFLAYPFNRYNRVETSVGFTQFRQDLPVGAGLTFRSFSDDFASASADFVADTTRFQFYGPWQGHRLRLGVTHYEFVGGDRSGENVDVVNADLRGYQHLTSSMVLAARVGGRMSLGDEGFLFSIGGINQLRGVEFRSLAGETVLYGNLELRFPLVNFMEWGIGLQSMIRGFAFVDVGTAWFEDELFLVDPETCLASGGLDCEIGRGKAALDPRTGLLRGYDAETDDGFLQDVYVSSGLGFWTPVLGLPLNWAFFRRYDGKQFGPWRSEFYITFDW